MKAHLNMEDLLDYVKPRTKKTTLILGSLMGAALCGLMAYESWNMCIHSIRTSEVTLMLEWPMIVVKIPHLLVIRFLELNLLPMLGCTTVILRITINS